MNFQLLGKRKRVSWEQHNCVVTKCQKSRKTATFVLIGDNRRGSTRRVHAYNGPQAQFSNFALELSFIIAWIFWLQKENRQNTPFCGDLSNSLFWTQLKVLRIGSVWTDSSYLVGEM